MRLLKTRVIIACILLLLSCGKSASNSSGGSNASNSNEAQPLSGETLSSKSDSGGVLTATVDSSSKKTQVINASTSSSIKGTQVAFPVNSLNINADVTVQQADSLVSNNTNADLGITDSSTVKSASNTVFVNSNPLVDPAKPFVLQIPTTSSLALAGSTGVLYRIQKAGSPGIYFTGFLPSSAFTVASNAVTITASYFGAYQLVTLSSSFSLVSEVQVTTPIVLTSQIFPTSAKWVSTCAPCRNNVPSCYEIDTFIANGSSISLELDHYTDSACTIQGDAWVAYSTYVVGPSVTTPSGGTSVDVYATKYLVTPTTIGALALNSKSVCGKTDWVGGTTKDITGNTSCDTTNPNSNSVRTIYSNFLLTSTTLQPGVPAVSGVDDGTSSDKRMTGSDSVIFTKQ